MPNLPLLLNAERMAHLDEIRTFSPPLLRRHACSACRASTQKPSSVCCFWFHGHLPFSAGCARVLRWVPAGCWPCACVPPRGCRFAAFVCPGPHTHRLRTGLLVRLGRYCFALLRVSPSVPVGACEGSAPLYMFAACPSCCFRSFLSFSSSAPPSLSLSLHFLLAAPSFFFLREGSALLL